MWPSMWPSHFSGLKIFLYSILNCHFPILYPNCLIPHWLVTCKLYHTHIYTWKHDRANTRVWARLRINTFETSHPPTPLPPPPSEIPSSSAFHPNWSNQNSDIWDNHTVAFLYSFFTYKCNIVRCDFGQPVCWHLGLCSCVTIEFM